MNTASFDPAVRRPARRSQISGFTLIEMMIVVAVIAILAAIALPAYNQYIVKARRTDAKNALLDLAAREERFYAINNAYSSTASELGYASFPLQVNTSGVAYYNIAQPTYVAATANGPATFSATATPIDGTAQASDTTCYAYTINSLGVQGNTGMTGSAAGCW